jgi:site-specific DNA recombinase
LNLRPLIPNLRQTAATESQNDVSDREIIERFVERIVINPQSIEIQLRDSTTADQITEVETFAPATNMAASIDEETATIPAVVISVPWSAPAFVSVKGVLHRPSGKATLKPETRDAILLAIVKARSWIGDLASGRVRSFAEIAQHEGKVERHIRLLAPLAFTAPEMLAAIIARSAPNDLTVTTLAQTMPYTWQREV